MYLTKQDLENPRIRRQIDRLLWKFGTNKAGLAQMLGVHRSVIQNWDKNTEVEPGKFYGGQIPAKNWDIIRALAIHHGVVLSVEDYDPRPYILKSKDYDEWVPYEH